MTTKTKPTTTKEQESFLSTLTTVSSKIRYLDSQKMTRGQISSILGIRYQWVRNVLITPVKAPKA